MSKPSAGGLIGRLPRATPSFRSASSSASTTSTTSSSASAVVAISQVASASRPGPASCLRAWPRPTALPDDQVADNFTLPAASSTLAPPDPLPNRDAVSDACSCSDDQFEPVVPAPAIVPRQRRAAFWWYLRVAALAVRAAVPAAILAVVVAADVALAVCLFPRRGTA